ncbi:hypothetical protein RchiOBHm_Chr7g0192311 [Rosa chinensis]|uniref:Uncharacterized protein n=1 Tax=Rosa chinensis TaxID=74649 RepID=A0A2P6P5H9_ROSCH|nr:hypothetical protein RchiOBHm_Chr7g0192311 [Rosa chinensis]
MVRVRVSWVDYDPKIIVIVLMLMILSLLRFVLVPPRLKILSIFGIDASAM